MSKTEQEETKAAAAENEVMAHEEEPVRTSTLEQLRKSVTEDDSAPTATLTLRKILGGDILSGELMRRQVWLFLLIALFITVYVAFRYQCQQDMIDIAKLELRLTDAKYKALSSSSNLTERCRESHVLDMLRAHQDSLIHTSTQPPYKIYIPE